VRIDSLVKTQAVQIVQQSYTVGEPDIRAMQVLYPMAQTAMGSGMYCPKRIVPNLKQAFDTRLRRGCRFTNFPIAGFLGDRERRRDP
jgi:hypothetical protein